MDKSLIIKTLSISITTVIVIVAALFVKIQDEKIAPEKEKDGKE